jgi:aminoglycoside phosphotransferase (APT) family kinase protein
VLAAVPGCEGGRVPLVVHPLAGGGHNDVQRVDTTVGRFVVRRHLSPLPPAGSDARFELECQVLAAHHGLAPRVVAAAADASWLVMELVPGTAWQEQELTSLAGARRIGARLAQVHALKAHADMRSMDGAVIARQQLQAITSAGKPAGEATELAHRACQLADIVRACGTPLCINHGDLQHSNLIGPLPMLVDWEYAQIAAPTYDVACLLTYYPALRASQADLLAAAGLSTTEDQELLELQEQLFSCLNRLWSIANGIDAG